MGEWADYWHEVKGDDPVEHGESLTPFGAEFILKRNINKGPACDAATEWMDGWSLRCTLIEGHDGPHLGRDRWNGLKAWEEAR
jgi:hypothetical protein